MFACLSVLGIGAFRYDRCAMLKPPAQQCLSHSLAILFCHTLNFRILQSNTEGAHTAVQSRHMTSELHFRREAVDFTASFHSKAVG